MQWRAIGTAPRDGTEFCAWGARVGRRVVNWPPGCQIGKWSEGSDGAWCGKSDVVAEGFTHWHPLPAPPEGGT
jgi:hypothetical protein